jgi:integrase
MRTVTKEDIRRVVDYLWEHRSRRSYLRSLAMTLLSWEGGLRATECCELTLGALDLDNCTATVRRKGGRKITTILFGIPTAATIAAYLKVRPQVPGETHVFLSSEGRPMTRVSWRLCLLRLARAAGIEHFSPHALRRGGSVEMMLNGCPDEVIMRLYGWSDSALLSRYTMAARMDRARQWLPTVGLELPAGFMESNAQSVALGVEVAR